jgi:hypothetical protein
MSQMRPLSEQSDHAACVFHNTLCNDTVTLAKVSFDRFDMAGHVFGDGGRS